MEKSKLNISVVSYLNSLPFVAGLEQEKIKQQYNISKDIPSICAEKVINGSADIGLMPIAMLPKVKGGNVITDYCISANGEVGSVLLVSNDPLEEIEVITKDNESRTSVTLARILIENHWKKEVTWKEESDHFLDLQKNEGLVIIGDRALKYSSQFKYVYDLAGEWKKFTGLPFVFACWIANKAIDNEDIKNLNESFSEGLKHRNEIAKKIETGHPTISTLSYLKEYIKYDLNEEAKKGMNLFLEMMNQIESSFISR
ncbi:MAG TPA: menaquinone biosynthesis protein [Bacteroidia bacterium]|jgi:chorismate dehydratase|nr:menaquinone biosynthesis protein [Bacteroidia bacterium]HQF27698.1 menaquinone biosynthesis protein [Bacteroidia bacterium]